MNNFEIIYFGNDWFAENKTSSHHIAERFAQRNKILYVECPGLRMPKGNTRDFRKIFKKIWKCISKPEQIGKQFWVYTLFQIPLHRFTFIRAFNEKLILFTLKRAMRQLGFTKPLLWFHIPHLYMVPGKIPAKGIVYYCIDNYSALPDVNKKAVQFMDDEMTRLADMVFAVSEPVYNSKKILARELLLSPHGVDFTHFNQVAMSTLAIPADIANISGPIIGFWGLIENRIDLDLVAYLAKRQPEWSLVLIGYVENKDNPCTGLENVYFLGQKKFSELPGYAKAFDVAMLPYRMDEFFYNCNPLKLREYLATGKPVVSLRNPEVEKYQDIVSIADDYADFAEKIAGCLLNDSIELAEHRVTRMRAESWDQRVEEIMKAVTMKMNLRQNNE